MCAEWWVRSVDGRPRTAVVLPGSGSDEVFVHAAFAAPLRAVGVGLVAPAPRRDAEVVRGHLAALDAALDRADGPLLVGGVSLGAHIAARWAASVDPRRLAGLLLALPAWTGPPDPDAPAALAARLTAAQVRRGGIGEAVAAARAGCPRWLADELTRAWTGYGPGLPDALDVAASDPGPTPAELATLHLPAGLAAVTGDPVHPVSVARRWHGLMPAAVLHVSALDAFGADPALLGRATVLGWLQTLHRVPAGGAGYTSQDGRW